MGRLLSCSLVNGVGMPGGTDHYAAACQSGDLRAGVDYGAGPEAQLFALRAYAVQRGFEVYREYIDYVSGASRSTPPRSRQRIRPIPRSWTTWGKRHVDCVLVWKYDRFARSLGVLVSAFEHFHSLGVDFISYTQHIHTTPMGRLFYHTVGSFRGV